jgi:hypothetical protein
MMTVEQDPGSAQPCVDAAHVIGRGREGAHRERASGGDRHQGASARPGIRRPSIGAVQRAGHIDIHRRAGTTRIRAQGERWCRGRRVRRDLVHHVVEVEGVVRIAIAWMDQLHLEPMDVGPVEGDHLRRRQHREGPFMALVAEHTPCAPTWRSAVLRITGDAEAGDVPAARVLLDRAHAVHVRLQGIDDLVLPPAPTGEGEARLFSGRVEGHRLAVGQLER